MAAQNQGQVTSLRPRMRPRPPLRNNKKLTTTTMAGLPFKCFGESTTHLDQRATDGIHKLDRMNWLWRCSATRPTATLSIWPPMMRCTCPTRIPWSETGPGEAYVSSPIPSIGTISARTARARKSPPSSATRRWKVSHQDTNERMRASFLFSGHVKLTHLCPSFAAHTEVYFRFEAGDHGGIAGDGFDNGRRWQAKSERRYTVTLQEILEHRAHAPAVMDYLSLDVEGIR
jgi:hypothetical protein